MLALSWTMLEGRCEAVPHRCLSPTCARYYENRVRAVQAAKARGENPYPHKFEVSIQLPAYVEKYTPLEAGTQVGAAGLRVAAPVGGGSRTMHVPG